MILAVVGAGATTASTVLSAIESEWLNTARNSVTTHPCKDQGTYGKPSAIVCMFLKLFQLGVYRSIFLTMNSNRYQLACNGIHRCRPEWSCFYSVLFYWLRHIYRFIGRQVFEQCCSAAAT